MRYYFLMIVVLLAGCATADEDPIRPSGLGLRLDAAAEPAEIKRGETLYIRLRVTNESDDVIVKHFGSTCIYGYALRNEQEELVAPPPLACALVALTIRYAPGKTITRDIQWVWDDPDIEPGTYLLYAGFGPRGEYESALPVRVRLQ